MSSTRIFSKDLKDSLEGRKILVPLVIFQSRPLTVLEALIRYLVDERKFNYHDTGLLLKRDERNIRDIYLHAKAKELDIKKGQAAKAREEQPKTIKTDIKVPVSVFADRRVSAVEALVVHLNEKHDLSFANIGRLLQRSVKTIWTAYTQARKKYAKQTKKAS